MTIQELVNYVEFKRRLKTSSDSSLFSNDNVLGKVFKRTRDLGFFVPIEVKNGKTWGVSIDIKNGQAVVICDGKLTYTTSNPSLLSGYKDCGPLKEFVLNAYNYHKIEEKKKEIEQLKEQLLQAERELENLMK
jgi:hypothetical protein